MGGLMLIGSPATEGRRPANPRDKSFGCRGCLSRSCPVIGTPQLMRRLLPWPSSAPKADVEGIPVLSPTSFISAEPRRMRDPRYHHRLRDVVGLTR